MLKLSDYIKRVLIEEGVTPEPTPEPVQEAIEPIQSTFKPSTPEEIEDMHASGIDPLHLVRTYPQAPTSVVLSALDKAPPPLKSHALVHDRIPTDKLIEASRNAIHHGAVSINPKTPPDILELLSKSEFEHVLDNVAGNKSTPKHVLHEMARKFKGHPIGETAKKSLGRKKK